MTKRLKNSQLVNSYTLYEISLLDLHRNWYKIWKAYLQTASRTDEAGFISNSPRPINRILTQQLGQHVRYRVQQGGCYDSHQNAIYWRQDGASPTQFHNVFHSLWSVTCRLQASPCISEPPTVGGQCIRREGRTGEDEQGNRNYFQNFN